jgi:hypothetical protein
MDTMSYRYIYHSFFHEDKPAWKGNGIAELNQSVIIIKCCRLQVILNEMVLFRAAAPLPESVSDISCGEGMGNTDFRQGFIITMHGISESIQAVAHVFYAEPSAYIMEHAQYVRLFRIQMSAISCDQSCCLTCI